MLGRKVRVPVALQSFQVFTEDRAIISYRDECERWSCANHVLGEFLSILSKVKNTRNFIFIEYLRIMDSVN